MLSFASFRSVIRELFADFVMSCIHGIQDFSDSENLLLCRCDLVLLVEVLLLSVEVDQFLVQLLIELLEILQASLDVAVFPEPILSSADVVQRMLDFVVA